MKKIDDSFIKNVERKVDDCSSIVQLFEVFKRYKPYIHNEYIFNSFLNRVDFFEHRSVDSFINNQCELLRDDLELERSITLMGARHYTNDLEINLVFYAQDGEIMKSCFQELVRHAMSMANGKKTEASRLLGIDLKTFNTLSNQKYSLNIEPIKKK